MNKITRSKDLLVPKVTTGPISASSKDYSAAEGHPDVRVPFREIALSKESGEGTFRVYDPSGPSTDAPATIDASSDARLSRSAMSRRRYTSFRCAGDSGCSRMALSMSAWIASQQAAS